MTNETQNKTATENNTKRESKVLDDLISNSKEQSRIDLANAMIDILNSTNEEGKRQLTLTVAMFNLPDIFTFGAIANVLALQGEKKTEARHKLLENICNEYTHMLYEQKAYSAIKGKDKTKEDKANYDDRKLKLDAMDKMVNLALISLYYLRHKETGNVMSVALQSAKNKRTDIKVTVKIGETIEADGSKSNNVESIVMNGSELVRRGRKAMPASKRNTNDTGKAATSGTANSALASMKLVTDMLATQATTLAKDKGLVDLPEATQLTVKDIFAKFLPVEFADRDSGVFNGDAFKAYVEETLKLKFEISGNAKRKTNGKDKIAA